MKRLKFCLTIALLILFVGVSNAQISGLSIGYCNGEVKKSGTTGFSTTAKNTWVSGAIYIPAEDIDIFGGNHIDSIHAGLASSLNVDSLCVWIRTSLDGENLAYGAISKTTQPKIAKGWNQIALATPYSISKSNDGIYIGYSFLQKSSSVALSVVPAPHENGLYVKLGDTATWTDRSTEGVLAIEALVYGENLPKYNLSLKTLQTQKTYTVSKERLEVQATIRNLATCTITAFDAVCTIDGIDETYTAHIDTALAYKEEKTVTFTIHPTGIENDEIETRSLMVNITNLKEGEDENPLDNMLSTTFSVVNVDFTRNVLMEEFTTEQCPNCPRVAAMIGEICTMDKYKSGGLNVLCHHAGYYTDWLTIPSDNEYLSLYNMGGSTFAPAVMIDRSCNSMWSNNAETSPIYSPVSTNEMMSVIDNRLLEPAFVSIDIKAYMDSANASVVHVTVEGERSKADFTKNPPRINVVLFENNIKARNQVGTTDFVHQHVSRTVNSAWGEELEWDGNNYTYSCDLALRADYVFENLGIIAYIWDYDQKDGSKNEVANSSSIHSADFEVESATGIHSLQCDDDIQGAGMYYNIQGEKLLKPQQGINIIKFNGKMKKVMINRR